MTGHWSRDGWEADFGQKQGGEENCTKEEKEENEQNVTDKV